MVLTLLPELYSTYNTKLAILTYNDILTLLTVLYSTLSIYTKTNSYLHYLQYGLHSLQKPKKKIRKHTCKCTHQKKKITN